MSFAIDPNMDANQASSQDIQARRRAMESLSSADNMDDAQKQAKLREACEGFESVFIQKMWEQMRATLPKDGFLKSKEEEFWQGMYDQELGKSMAASGGIGLANMMMEQLDRNKSDIGAASSMSAYRRPMMDIPPRPPAGPGQPRQAEDAPGPGKRCRRHPARTVRRIVSPLRNGRRGGRSHEYL